MDIRIIPLMLNYLDAVDEAVSKRLIRKKPWDETALTSQLCDLLDDDTDEDTPIRFTLDEFRGAVSNLGSGQTISLELEAHEYKAGVERYVTQSDLGLIIKIEDSLNPERSRRMMWLLQSKRLFPSPGSKSKTATYSTRSQFQSFDQQQHERMAKLNDLVGADFVKYLLYCPRLPSYEATSIPRLRFRQQAQAGSKIFDYAMGLELNRHLASGNPSLDAGMIVSDVCLLPAAPAKLQEHMFDSTHPFSWFIAQSIFGFVCPLRNPLALTEHPAQPITDDSIRLAHGIITGEAAAVERVISALGDSNDRSLKFVPAHTCVLTVANRMAE